MMQQIFFLFQEKHGYSHIVVHTPVHAEETLVSRLQIDISIFGPSWQDHVVWLENPREISWF
jgi:hypothetical protein